MALLNSFRMAGKRMLVHRSLLPKFLFLLALLLTTGRAMAQEMYAVFTNDGTLTFYYDNLRSTRTGDTYDMNIGDSKPDWQSAHSSKITKAVFDASFADARPTSTAYWFSNGSTSRPIKEIVGIVYLNTENVTDMRRMFWGCSGLTFLDVSNFNTANVTDMNNMFSGCTGLTSLDVSNFNTANVTNMAAMFYGCSGLTSLDVSNFNTSKVTGTGMAGMFTDCSGLTSLDVSNFNTEKATNMYIMFNGCSGLTSLDVSNFNTANVTDMWGMFYGCSGLTSLDVSNFNTANVTDMSTMFRDCSALTSLDVSNFNTANVTDMWGMFSGCTGLTSLDVSNFNTANVTNMNGMFSGCSALTSLDVSNFNTANVTDMSVMFYNFKNLASLDVSNFNTEKVTNMRWMFGNCYKLTSLDLSNFNTVNVTNMYAMFYSNYNLKTIHCGDGWTTEKVTESEYMFYGCSNLAGGVGTAYDSNQVDVSYAHADRGASNPGYLTDQESLTITTAYAVYNEGTLTFYYDNLRSTRTGETYFMNSGYSYPGWNRDHRLEITKAVFDASFADARPTSTAYWFGTNDISKEEPIKEIVGIECLNTEDVTIMRNMFEGCRRLTSLDVSNFNTEKVTDMSDMFSCCFNLTSLDVSNFNTANVTNMNGMFSGCSALTSLDVSNFNTEKVTDMSDMFEGCRSLTSLDVSKFNTANVIQMYDMFLACESLSSLDVSNFNTDNVISMGGMFADCSGLTSLDISNFNTENVTSMDWMFRNCSGLTSLDISKFNTSNVTRMQGMFEGCSGLTSLDVSNFNTANVTAMVGMFEDCSGLTSLDVTNFNTENVTLMGVMFYGCSGLTSLDLSNFNTTNVTNMEYMFSGCSGLTSLDVSNFNTSNVTNMADMFSGCSNLTSISLGDGMVNMPDFSTCQNLMEVNAYSKEPQAFASNCFADNVKENATLNVYVGTKPVYESTGGWNEFKNIVEKFIIPHNEENVSYGNGGEIDESTDLNGNTIGNIYYNIGSDNGEYNSTEGCITLTKAVSDEEISTLESENIFGDDFKNRYNGIVFMLQAGSGTIKVTAESVGNMTLKVKIGENEPITEELVGKTVSTFPYSVTEPTYVYIYGGASASGASPMHRAGPAENALKIYGIEWTESDTPSAIGTVREAAPTEDTVIYSLDGQRLQQTRKGINIVNGKKVVIK